MKQVSRCRRSVLSILLTLTLMFSLLPVQVLAAEMDYVAATVETYTVTFKNYNGNTTLGQKNVEADGVLTSATINEQILAPERTNFNFMGWSATQGDIGEMDTTQDEFTVTADTTLYAVYSRNKMNLIYMTGSNEDDPGVEIARFRQNINDRSNQIRLANTVKTIADWQSYVTKDGFRFLGWKRAEAGQPLSNNFMTNSIWTGAADLYMYAQYERTSPLVEYTVSIKNYNGSATLGTMTLEADTVLAAATINNQVSAPERANSSFMGWSATKGDIGETDTVQDEFTITADTTLYAVYSRNKINLIYMTGSNEDDPGVEIARFRQNTNDHTNQIRLANTIQTIADWQSYITKDGFRFLGWKRAEAGQPLSNNFMTNSIWTGAADLYMYAQYEQTAVTHQVSLKNNDGTELLGMIPVVGDQTLTAAKIAEVVSEADALRNAYVFMGWSAAPGDVDDTFTAPEEFEVTVDIDLYAVYRPIQPGDIDEQLMMDLSDAVDGLETAVTSVGLTLNTVTTTPDREEVFYTYLKEYLESRFPKEMALALANAENVYIMNDRAASANGSRKVHAAADATWMMSKRPDLNYAKEVLYQYTSHYIDVPDPFAGTYVTCGNESYQKYVTDLDRRTYDLFYSKGRGIDIYKNMMTVTTVAAGGKELAGGVKQITTLAGDVEFFYNIANSSYNLSNVLEAAPGLTNNYYSRLVSTPCEDKESFFAAMDGLIDDIEKDLRPDYGIESAKYAAGVFLAVGGVALGGSLFVAGASLIGTANTALVSLLDRVNFLAMRMYIQTRITERMMFAWGWTDGRN